MTTEKNLINLVDRSNLSTRTYHLIKNLILSKDISEKINLDNLAERLGVSRTPVISALNKLESEGFVVNVPYKGYSIKTLSEKEIKELLEIRVLFESLGVEKLIKNGLEKPLGQVKSFLEKFEKTYSNEDIGKYRELDISFHKFIVKNSENDTVIKYYNKFIIIPALITTFLIPEESIKDHRVLISCILNRNVAGAKKIIKDHTGLIVS